MKQPKLVEFDNGKFGVLIPGGWSRSDHFVDLKDPRYKWDMTDGCFRFCQGTREEAEEVFRDYPMSRTKRGYRVIE